MVEPLALFSLPAWRREASMGSMDRCADLVKRIVARMRAIDRELRSQSIIPEEADEHAVQDRLPVGRTDPVLDLRCTGLVRERRALEERLAQCRRDEEISCEECEEPIAAERLLAVPTATRCVRCQAHVERTDLHMRLRALAIA